MKKEKYCKCPSYPGKVVYVKDIKDPICPDCGERILITTTSPILFEKPTVSSLSPQEGITKVTYDCDKCPLYRLFKDIITSR